MEKSNPRKNPKNNDNAGLPKFMFYILFYHLFPIEVVVLGGFPIFGQPQLVNNPGLGLAYPTAYPPFHHSIH